MSDTQKQNTVDTEQKVETEEIVDTEKPRFVVGKIDVPHEPTERSNDEILRVFNKRRPYCPNDFKTQSFIPNLRHLFDEKQR